MALALKEVQKVLDFVRRIKESGRACIYIEHNLAHVHELADRLVVLDRGEIVSVIGKGELSLAELIRHLLQLQSAREVPARHDPPPGPASRRPPIINVLLVLVAVFMIAAPQVFLGYRIYMSFLATVPPQLMLALGLTLVIASGEIDLSFPSVIAFSGFLFAWAFKTHELTWLALLLALAGGALIGWVNGVLVVVIGMPSIIPTLAPQFFWAGITRVMTGGLSYAIRTIDEYAIHKILVGRIGVVPVQALWAILIAVALWFVLTATASASASCSSAAMSEARAS
jgi:predicted ABC-type sugar transport system permease subunit